MRTMASVPEKGRPDDPRVSAERTRTPDRQTSMKVYRLAWLIVCATLAALGVAVLLLLSPAALTYLFGVSAALGAILTLPAAVKHGTRPRTASARRVLTGALGGGTLASACVGFAIVLGAGVFLLILAVAVSSPYAVGAYIRWMGSVPASSTMPVAGWASGVLYPTGLAYPAPGWAPPQVGPDLRRLSTHELCRAWCASYLILVDRSSGSMTKAVLATVEERQSYLDEFERRNATGLAAWLASDARVASNPLPYLVEDRADRSVINWDELI
jgi:hypothetical protein